MNLVILKQTAKLTLAAAAIILPLTAGGAKAQNLMSIAQANMAFDARMNAQLQAMQRANAAYGQQIWQNYMQQFGPQLRAEYNQLRPPMTFEQFAYYNLVTAHGTNVQGALDAQKQQFAGLQAAHNTQMAGFNSYNAAMAKNSAATTAAVDRWDRIAVQGNAPYVTPQGNTVWLPYSQPAGQPVNLGGTTYAQNQAGTYYQLQGNWWTSMQPGR